MYFHYIVSAQGVRVSLSNEVHVIDLFCDARNRLAETRPNMLCASQLQKVFHIVMMSVAYIFMNWYVRIRRRSQFV